MCRSARLADVHVGGGDGPASLDPNETGRARVRAMSSGPFGGERMLEAQVKIHGHSLLPVHLPYLAKQLHFGGRYQISSSMVIKPPDILRASRRVFYPSLHPPGASVCKNI